MGPDGDAKNQMLSSFHIVNQSELTQLDIGSDDSRRLQGGKRVTDPTQMDRDVTMKTEEQLDGHKGAITATGSYPQKSGNA